MSEGTTNDDWYDSALYKLIVDGFPKFVKAGRIEVKELAGHLGYSYEVVYRWFRTQKMGVKNANRIVAKSDGHILLNELTPYVFAE